VIGNPARRNAPDNANVTQTTNPAPAQPIRTGRTRFLLTMTPRTRLHHPPTAHPPDVVTTTASSSYRVTVHSRCASAGSLLAPETLNRSRYRAACSGLTAYTRYPAAINAWTHGPRSVSIPIRTPASASRSASGPNPAAIIAWNRAIPAIPSGSLPALNRRPASSITSTS